MTRLNALLLSLLLASLFSHASTWPLNFAACMACSLCTLCIGLVNRSERPPATSWSEPAVLDLPRAVIERPAFLRRNRIRS
jgi:hypothetical protein